MYDGILAAQTAVFQSFLQSGERVPHSEPITGWMTGKISGVDELPPGWRIVKLVDVARLESGHTPDRKKPEYWGGGNVEWISLHDTQNLERCDICHTEMRITEAGLANSSARLLPAGTVCFSRTATVGKCVIMAKPMATSQDFANFVCSPELNNRYLLHLMRWMQPVWKALASGSTHKTIYMPTFKALQIILPPRAEQDEIAATMDSFVTTAEGHAASLAHLRSLKANLMSDLFSGRVRVSAAQKAVSAQGASDPHAPWIRVGIATTLTSCPFSSSSHASAGRGLEWTTRHRHWGVAGHSSRGEQPDQSHHARF